jgi:hypothetical protein
MYIFFARGEKYVGMLFIKAPFRKIIIDVFGDHVARRKRALNFGNKANLDNKKDFKRGLFSMYTADIVMAALSVFLISIYSAILQYT